MGSCSSQTISFNDQQLKILHRHTQNLPEGAYLLSSIKNDNQMYVAIETKNTPVKYHSNRIVESQGQLTIKVDGWLRNFSIHKWYKKSLKDINEQHRSIRKLFTAFEYDNLLKQTIKGYHEMLTRELMENKRNNQSGELCIKMSNIRIEEVYVSNYKHSYSIHILPPMFQQYQSPKFPEYSRISGQQISILGLIFLDLGLLQPITILTDDILKGYIQVIEHRYPGKGAIIQKLIHGISWNQILEDLGLNLRVSVKKRDDHKTIIPISNKKYFTDPVREGDTIIEPISIVKQIPINTIISQQSTPIKGMVFSNFKSQPRSKSANIYRQKNNSYNIIVNPPSNTSISPQKHRSQSINGSQFYKPGKKVEIIHKKQLQGEEVNLPASSVSIGNYHEINQHKSHTRNILDGYIPIYSNRGLLPQPSIQVIQQSPNVKSKRLIRVSSNPMMTHQSILLPSEKCIQCINTVKRQNRSNQMIQSPQNPQMTFQRDTSQYFFRGQQSSMIKLFTPSRPDNPLNRTEANLLTKYNPSTQPDPKQSHPLIKLQMINNQRRIKRIRSNGLIRTSKLKIKQENYQYDDESSLFQQPNKNEQFDSWSQQLQQSFIRHRRINSRRVLEYQGRNDKIKPNIQSSFFQKRIYKQYECIKMKDGSQYRGEIKNGKPDGKGQLWDPNGFKLYTGQFKSGLFDGIGIENNPKKPSRYENHNQNYNMAKYWVQYKGLFRQGQRHGRGILTMANGQKYSVIFKNGRLQNSKLQN